jgi:hypothetical protein
MFQPGRRFGAPVGIFRVNLFGFLGCANDEDAVSFLTDREERIERCDSSSDSLKR